MRRKIIKNLFILIDDLIIIEKENGVVFNEKGYPIFEKNMFVQSVPKYMRPFSHKKDTFDYKNTSVTFYESDKILYRRLTLPKLESTANELLNYHSFVGFDLSIFNDYLYPFQEFFILVNLIIDMFFILKGNKMIPNLRADQTGGESYFALLKEAPIVCCGTLGCSKYKEIKYENRKKIKNYALKHCNQTIIQYGSNLVKANNLLHFKSYRRAKYG
ncbi:MAG TPA: hypothetical protein DDW20_04265 [Firmicutes bacterium]|nr:hypothetical protein [Bacillota bacterium]